MNSRFPIGTYVEWTVPYIKNPRDAKRSGMVVSHEQDRSGNRYLSVLLFENAIKLGLAFECVVPDLEAARPFTGTLLPTAEKECATWRKERGIVLDDDTEVYEDRRDEGYD